MKPLRPFFPFYGSKWRCARLYPAPEHATVIEPFAGAAGYATYYGARNVVLVDVDPVLCALWLYLIHASEDEILRLPDLSVGDDVHDKVKTPEERALLGFWINKGSSAPHRRVNQFSTRSDKGQLVWGAKVRTRIASQLHAIRHWTVVHGRYQNVDAPQATWFVDPPYVDKGRYYRHRDVDYAHLAQWCTQRRGQVIACENAGAAWLPFVPLAPIKSTKGVSHEVVWLNK